jgi:hypothetical protein
MEQWSDPDPGSGRKHPGSATLADPLVYLVIIKKKGKKENLHKNYPVGYPFSGPYRISGFWITVAGYPAKNSIQCIPKLKILCSCMLFSGNKIDCLRRDLVPVSSVTFIVC